MNKRLFTSESVTEGHPDKVCDRVSDSILDAILKSDPMARVACETATTTGLIFVGGEITTKAVIDVPEVVRSAVEDIGYTKSEYGLDARNCGVIVAIDKQSPDIAQGVDKALEVRNKKLTEEDKINAQGAGDQGMVFGYACNETKELMPMPISLAQKLCMKMAEVRKNGTLKYLRPDGKSQVTVVYESNKPIAVDTIVLSAQHNPDVSIPKIEKDLRQTVIPYVIPEGLISKKTRVFVNPTGRFVIGGPHGDTGLTGRKIIVDTYGGYARHGGGAYSGKDPSKVDRSASYMARYAAKNIIASGAAEKCEIQISYAIGVAKPISVYIDTFGTNHVDENKLLSAVLEIFDFRPAAIIKNLNLRRPIYTKTAAYGHFGRDDKDFTWERTDKVKTLKKALNI